MKMSNLIQINRGFSNMEIDTNEEYSFNYSTVQQGEENKSTIWYDRATLYSLADKVRSDPRYKVLNHRTCNNIRKLKLLRRGCKGGKKRSHLDIIHQTGSNKNNLYQNKRQNNMKSDLIITPYVYLWQTSNLSRINSLYYTNIWRKTGLICAS